MHRLNVVDTLEMFILIFFMTIDVNRDYISFSLMVVFFIWLAWRVREAVVTTWDFTLEVTISFLLSLKGEPTVKVSAAVRPFRRVALKWRLPKAKTE